MTKNKSTNKFDAEIEKFRHEKTMAWIGIIPRLVDKSPWLALCFFGYLAIDSISGKTTSFSALGNIVASIGVSNAVPYCLAALCGVGYYRESRLRKKTILDMGKRCEEYEKRLDPNRKTSGLMPNGEQRPEDKHGD
jgi:hypothetical protein